MSGTVTTEGQTERRTQAFPVRYAESAQARLVEYAPVNGAAWLSVDGGPPAQVAVRNRTATSTFATPLPPGNHLFVVALVNDSTCAAIAVTRSVGP